MSTEPGISDDEAWHQQLGRHIDHEAKVNRPARKAPPTKVTYEATDPAGRIHSKVSGTVAYTHVVFVLPDPDHDPIRAPGYLEKWQAIGWLVDELSAERLGSQQRARKYFADVQIVAVSSRGGAA